MPRLRVPALLLGALPLSCVAHVPGSLQSQPDVYAVRSVGCLEIAVRALRDPVLAFTVGNACRYPVGVDFRELTVRAWGAHGQVYHPTISDPRHELRAAMIDGTARADVALDFPVPESTPTFCVEVGRLNSDTPAPGPEEMCFRVDAELHYTRAIPEEEAHP
jgi:hypothetical protein